jgi:nucleosome assembly protein 1-like 1
MSQTNEYDYEQKFQESLKKITSNSLKQKLVAIRNIVVKRLGLEKEFKSQQFKLESKYEELYKPYYQKRAKIVEGTQEVTVDEIKEQLSQVSLKDVNAPTTEKGIPNFWLTCIKNTAQFESLVNANDEKVLVYLKDITCDFKDNGSFILYFWFDKNAHFDHEVLTKEHILDTQKLSISKIVSTKIEWKSEDLNPTVEKKKKKLKSKIFILIYLNLEKKEVKVVTSLVDVPSFFSFFKNYDINDEVKNKKDEESDNEEEEEEIEEIMEDEYNAVIYIYLIYLGSIHQRRIDSLCYRILSRCN